MYKKKPFFVTFEGIEGSGKTYLSRKLFKQIKKNKIPSILTREPGGTTGAEKIRKVILEDYFYKKGEAKFDKYTDTLLYLAARNEHILKKIKPALLEKKVVICDRFVDSTIAYQVFGKGIEMSLVNSVHKYILDGIKPNLTFVVRVDIQKAFQRLKKRKNKNRYDKFSKYFYIKAQNAFLKIAKKNKKRYYVIDNSTDSNAVQKIILNKFFKSLEKS